MASMATTTGLATSATGINGSWLKVALNYQGVVAAGVNWFGEVILEVTTPIFITPFFISPNTYSGTDPWLMVQ